MIGSEEGKVSSKGGCKMGSERVEVGSEEGKVGIEGTSFGSILQICRIVFGMLLRFSD
jgi:hypothetical protein